MLGLPSILSLFRNEFNKVNSITTRMLDSNFSYDIKITLKSHFCRKKRYNFVIMNVITFPENL